MKEKQHGSSSSSYNIIKGIYENSAMPVIIIDKNMKIIWSNKSSLSQFPQLVEAKDIISLISPLDSSSIQDKLLKGQEVSIGALEFPVPFCSLNIEPVMESGHLSYAVVHLMNHFNTNTVTLDEREKVINNLISQFRNPLTIIFSVLGPLMRKFEETEDYVGQEYVNHITQNCYKMLRTCTNMNDLYKYENNVDNFRPQTGDLSDFISNICQAAALLIRPTSVPLVFSIPKDAIITSFDPDKLTFALANLILNSCLYSREGNEIKITLSRQGDRAVITVADKGRGIDEKQLSKIFLPYFTGDNKDPSISTAGLGLAVVHKIIQMHKGSIVVNSEENEGTTFALSLPIVEDPNLPHYLKSSATNYLTNHFSPLYVGLADICAFSC